MPDPTQRLPGSSLFPIAVALSQPPSAVTCLSVCELHNSSQQQNATERSVGILVGMGSAHGFALLHVKTGSEMVGSVVFHHSTLPANPEALEEASIGDGWARRRTRELKNSLRDSFRRLKRVKSGRSTANSPPPAPAAKPPTGSPPVAVKFNDSMRVGLRKSVTRVNFPRFFPQNRNFIQIFVKNYWFLVTLYLTYALKLEQIFLW